MGVVPKKGSFKKFNRLIRNQVAELIRTHGMKEAHKLAPVPMSFSIVTQIAKEYGIELVGLKQDTLRLIQVTRK